MGVSPRRLMGWEPATVTTYEYEGDRLVRSVSVQEPEFSLTDLASLLRQRADERAPRGSHGFLLSEATSPDADPNSWDSKYKFVAVGPKRDFAKTAQHNAEREFAKQHPDADLTGLSWAVERVER